jgi:hypothetical protein
LCQRSGGLAERDPRPQYRFLDHPEILLAAHCRLTNQPVFDSPIIAVLHSFSVGVRGIPTEVLERAFGQGGMVGHWGLPRYIVRYSLAGKRYIASTIAGAD